MNDGIRFSELVAYTAEENRRWKEFFREHPQAMDLPCDIAASPTVHNFLLHIFTTDLYFAHRLLGLAPPDFKALPHATIDELFGIGEGAAGEVAAVCRSRWRGRLERNHSAGLSSSQGQ
jgi:uncharacterized damage-inducible protein DinB